MGPGITNDLWLEPALPSLIDTALLSPAREAWAPITSYRSIKVGEAKVWLWGFPSRASRQRENRQPREERLLVGER